MKPSIGESMTIQQKQFDISAPGALGQLPVIMCVVIAAGGLLALAAAAWVWAVPDYFSAFVVPRLGLVNVPVTLDGATRLEGFAISMIPMLLLFFMLYQAYALFGSFRIGSVFADDAPARLRRIALGLIALAALRPVTGALIGAALTASNPAGQRILAFGLSIDDYMIAALGGLLLVLARVFLEANRLSDENRQIV
jgi:Protein of unknown function (DUF2975)